jgi:hypothetical protein
MENARKIESIILGFIRGLIEKQCIQLIVPKFSNKLVDGKPIEKLCTVDKTVQYLRVLSCCYNLVLRMAMNFLFILDEIFSYIFRTENDFQEVD